MPSRRWRAPSASRRGTFDPVATDATAAVKLTYGTPWLLASIILYSAAVTITLSGVAPLLSRAGRELADGKPARGYGLIAALSGSATLLLVAVVVLMVWRP